jgi:hypothetical protein
LPTRQAAVIALTSGAADTEGPRTKGWPGGAARLDPVPEEDKRTPQPPSDPCNLVTQSQWSVTCPLCSPCPVGESRQVRPSCL